MRPAKAPSYVGAFLTHPVNTGTVLAVLAAGVVGSFGMGLGAITLSLLAVTGIETVGLLFVPAMEKFRRSVDGKARREARDEARRYHLATLDGMNAQSIINQFRAMDGRVRQLYQAVRAEGSTLAVDDVERLEDLTVDFLGLAQLHQSMGRKKESVSDGELTRRINELESQLADKARSDDERRALQAAQAEYRESLARNKRLVARRARLEALMLSLPDKVEEVYQLVMSAPFQDDVGSKIEQSLSRLRIAEEVASELDDGRWSLADDSPQPGTASLAAARQARMMSTSNSRR